MRKSEKEQRLENGCELCGREVKLTFHHLIPCAVHKRKRYIEKFGKEEMRSRGLFLCKLCHSAVHDLIEKERDLADHYHTRELLLTHPAITKHVAWASKQKVHRHN